MFTGCKCDYHHPALLFTFTLLTRLTKVYNSIAGSFHDHLYWSLWKIALYIDCSCYFPVVVTCIRDLFPYNVIVPVQPLFHYNNKYYSPFYERWENKIDCQHISRDTIGKVVVPIYQLLYPLSFNATHYTVAKQFVTTS